MLRYPGREQTGMRQHMEAPKTSLHTPYRAIVATEVRQIAGHMAAVTSRIGQVEFGTVLLDFLAHLIRFDCALIVYYRRSRRPDLVAERFDHALRENTLDAYMREAYRIDPVFVRTRKADVPEIVRTRDLVDDQFEKTAYFRSYYKLSNVADEINILIPIQEGRVFSISLERARGDVEFSPEDFERLVPWLNWLVEMFRLHREAAPDLSHPEDVDPDVEQLDALLARFGEDILTPREQEVAALILNGHSVADIARDLDVSVETIRVHRRNIYEKLDVNSLAELFSLALQTIDAIRTGQTPPLA